MKRVAVAVLLLALLGVVACGDDGPKQTIDRADLRSHDDQVLGAPSENVAGCAGGDDISAVYVERLLAKAGIRSYISGSISWSVKVPATAADDARRILAQEEGLRDFVWVEGVDDAAAGSKQLPAREWEHSLAMEKSLDEVLRVNDAHTDMGRIVREALRMWWDEPPAGVIVKGVRWTRRPFLSKSLLATTAIEAEVTFDGPDGPFTAPAYVMPID